jgi:SAM-dependent methyltransferase
VKQCLDCGNTFNSAGWSCPKCGWKPGFIDGFLAFSPDIAKQSDGFKPGAHDDLFAREAACFWFRNRNSLLKSMLNRYFPSSQSLLEIGCGTGFVLAGLAEARPYMRMIGAEIYTSGLRLAQKRAPHSDFIQMDALRTPFVEEFDVIGAFDVLEHIQDDQEALEQIFKAVKPGGGLIISVPQHRWLWSAADEIACHKRRYTRSELNSKVKSAGFRIIMISSFVTLLLPVMILSRFKWRSSGCSNACNEFDMPRWMDSAFQQLCDIERVILQHGMRLPVGGSLLCVALKA